MVLISKFTQNWIQYCSNFICSIFFKFSRDQKLNNLLIKKKFSMLDSFEDTIHSSALASNSKKIQKQPKTIKKDLDSEKLFRTGYETYTKDEKLRILSSLKRQIVSYFELSHSKGSKDWNSYLDKLDTNKSASFFIKAFPSGLIETELTPKRVAQLKKKIKGWFSSENKSEKRGGAVVSEEELPRFLIRIKTILNDMKTRCFTEFQEKIRSELKELYPKLGREFKGTECSKHWWHEFQERHDEIRTAWKDLPVSRSKKISTNSPLTPISNPSTCITPSPFPNEEPTAMELEDSFPSFELPSLDFMNLLKTNLAVDLQPIVEPVQDELSAFLDSFKTSWKERSKTSKVTESDI